jgi:hypothetical protein
MPKFRVYAVFPVLLHHREVIYVYVGMLFGGLAGFLLAVYGPRRKPRAPPRALLGVPSEASQNEEGSG